MEGQRNYYAIIPANVRYDKELPASAKLLYGEITALCNDKGYCWATNEYFSKLYNVSKKSITRWISLLIQKGYLISKFEYNEGSKEIAYRYVQIVSNPMDKNEDTPGQKCLYPMDKNVHTPMDKNVQDNNTSINNTINNKKELYKYNSKKENQFIDEFEQLWKLYPKKEGKVNAQKKYIALREKNKITFDQVKNGIEAYCKYLEKNKTDRKYIKQGSTWFNQECWNDEYGVEEEMKKDKILYLDEIYYLKDDGDSWAVVGEVGKFDASNYEVKPFRN